jgi:hypothetical protein
MKSALAGTDEMNAGQAEEYRALRAEIVSLLSRHDHV